MRPHVARIDYPSRFDPRASRRDRCSERSTQRDGGSLVEKHPHGVVPFRVNISSDGKGWVIPEGLHMRAMYGTLS